MSRLHKAALPSAVEHFQFIGCIYFLKCFLGERKINILRDCYDIFWPAVQIAIALSYIEACPGSLGPKAFTIGGENTTLKKYKIMNSELHTKININL